MHPTTHILTGWCLAELAPDLGRREKTAIVIAAAVPDLDGLGVLAEIATRDSEHPLLWWTEFHHVLGHNLLFAALFAVLAGAVCRSLRAGALVVPQCVAELRRDRGVDGGDAVSGVAARVFGGGAVLGEGGPGVGGGSAAAVRDARCGQVVTVKSHER